MHTIRLNGLWGVFLFVCMTGGVFLPDSTGAQTLERFTFTKPKMGSPFTITLYAADAATASFVSEQGFSIADSLNAIFSDYLPGSELSKLNKQAGSGDWVDVSPNLLQILKISENASIRSDGFFDISVGPVVMLWRKARKDRSIPDKNALKKALKLVGYKQILMDTAGGRVKLLKPGMLLDLGGIAKGFVAQAVVDKIKESGVSSVLVDAGGDIAVGDAPPGKAGWVLGINAPESSEHILNETLTVNNQTVSTSGDVYQYVLINGKKYSHIINPKTGIGATTPRNVTVIASSGAMSDWLATACSLLSVRKAKKLVNKTDGAALLLVELRHGKIRKWESARYKSFVTGNW